MHGNEGGAPSCCRYLADLPQDPHIWTWLPRATFSAGPSHVGIESEGSVADSSTTIPSAWSIAGCPAACRRLLRKGRCAVDHGTVGYGDPRPCEACISRPCWIAFDEPVLSSICAQSMASAASANSAIQPQHIKNTLQQRPATCRIVSQHQEPSNRRPDRALADHADPHARGCVGITRCFLRW